MEEQSLDNKMLAYLFDPDEGLKQDVEDDLGRLHSQLEQLDNLQKTLLERHSGKDAWRENFQQRERAIEITKAEIEFYTDVWAKVQDSVNKVIRVKGPSPAYRMGIYTVGIDWGEGAQE